MKYWVSKESLSTQIKPQIKQQRLIHGLEVRRSMSVVTGIETESAFMENLHGRRREMVDMTETNLGDIVQDFHWMMRTDFHLSQ